VVVLVVGASKAMVVDKNPLQFMQARMISVQALQPSDKCVLLFLLFCCLHRG